MKKLLIASSDEILLALIGAITLFIIALSFLGHIGDPGGWKPIIIIFAICFAIFFVMLSS